MYLKNIKKLGISATLKINLISRKLETEGKQIYKLGFGQSPFPVPLFLQESLKQHVDKKSYLPVTGLVELRKSIGKFYSYNYKLDIDEKNIFIGPGTKELLFMLQMITINQTNLLTPSWVSYANQCEVLGMKYTYLNTLKDLEQNSTLFLNSPNNPTGQIINFKSLTSQLNKSKPIVISDEIYSFLNYKNEFPDTLLKHYDNTIVSNGISKWCGAGGWRLGYIIIPNNLLYLKKYLSTLASEISSSVNAPVQYACIDLFDNFHKMENYLFKCNFCLGELSNIIYNIFLQSKIKCIKPEGAFYFFLDFNEYASSLYNKGIFTSNDLCNKLLDDTGVAILSGSFFGIDEYNLTARLSFVDFNGNEIINNNNLSHDDINTICKKTIEGCLKLVEYLD